MKIEVSGIHGPVQSGVDEYIHKKLEKLTRYLDRGVSVKVVLRVERQSHITEVNVVADRVSIHGEGRSEDVYVSVEKAADKVMRQAQKHKEKLKSHKRGGRAIQEEGSRSTPDSSENPAGPIHITRQLAKPMDIDEAVMQLNLSRERFLVFLNAASGKVNVVYKMNSRGYGLIEPEA